MKKVITIAVMTVILLSFVGCATVKPENTVKKFFTATQTLDTEIMSSTIVTSNTSGVTAIKDLLKGDKSEMPTYVTDYLKNNAAKMTYKVTGIEINGDKAVVMVDCKYVDGGPLFKATFTSFFMKALPLAFSGTELTQEQTNQMLIDIMKEQSKLISETFKEVSLKVNCVKKDKAWYISEITDEMKDVAMSGFISVGKEYNNAFGGSGDTQSKKTADVLREIDSYVTSDLWNKGFCDISWYLQTGKGSTGQQIDIEFTKSQLAKAMEKKVGYDTYIAGMDSSYSAIKDIWSKLSKEIDSLNQQVQSGAKSIDTGRFTQYHDAFSDSVSKLK